MCVCVYVSTHIPLKTSNGNTSSSSSPSQTNEQTWALWTGKQGRTDLCTPVMEETPVQNSGNNTYKYELKLLFS